jgi:hypothetical protein
LVGCAVIAATDVHVDLRGTDHARLLVNLEMLIVAQSGYAAYGADGIGCAATQAKVAAKGRMCSCTVPSNPQRALRTGDLHLRR